MQNSRSLKEAFDCLPIEWVHLLAVRVTECVLRFDFELQVYSKYTWANPLHVDIFPDGKFDLLAQLWNVKQVLVFLLLICGMLWN